MIVRLVEKTSDGKKAAIYSNIIDFNPTFDDLLEYNKFILNQQRLVSTWIDEKAKELGL